MESRPQQRPNTAQPNCAPHCSFPNWKTSSTCRHLTTNTCAVPDRNTTQHSLFFFPLSLFQTTVLALNAEKTCGRQKQKDERDTKGRAQSPRAARGPHSAPPSAALPFACLIITRGGPAEPGGRPLQERKRQTHPPPAAILKPPF